MIKNSGKMFDFLILGPGEKLSTKQLKEFKNKPCYIQQGNIIFKLINNEHFSYLTPTDKDLEDFYKDVIKDELEYDDSVHVIKNDLWDIRFPLDKFRDVARYFVEVQNKFKCESAVLLYVHPTKKVWDVLYPVQVGTSGTSVKYLYPNIEESEYPDKSPETKALMEKTLKNMKKLEKDGYILFGTIHSHPTFSAFHSGVDDEDELQFDGLHITIGNLTTNFTYSCRWIFGTAPFKVEIKDVLGIENESEIMEDLSKIDFDTSKLDLILKTEAPSVAFGFKYVARNGEVWNTDHIIPESDGVRLYSKQTQEIIYVREQYFLEHRKTHFKNWVRIEMGPEPSLEEVFTGLEDDIPSVIDWERERKILESGNKAYSDWRDYGKKAKNLLKGGRRG